ncbi:MAG: peptidoglycan-binding protein [Clostridia bacterium]|nr:peptidoglycan-binding protein [Clostridia bacterium]
MAKIIVYNNNTRKMETYNRDENEAMPYNSNQTLKVKEFRGSSNSNIIWTSKKTMESWNSQRSRYGKPIPVGFAFKRSWEGGHSTFSQHFAGQAFDVGQYLSSTERDVLYRSAKNSGLWSYVEPQNLTPTWVHFDIRYGTASCSTVTYPQLSYGSVGTYVLIAQDNLNTLGYGTGGLDGIFGSITQSSTKEYQRRVGLKVDGIIGCNTWKSLQESVLGTGKTSTTID